MSRHWTKEGTVRQSFKIKADLTPLIEYLTDRIIESVQDKDLEIEVDESYVDIDQLVIVGSYDTPYKWTHYDATHLDPPENDIDRMYLGDIVPEPELPEELKTMIKNINVEEDEDDADYRD